MEFLQAHDTTLGFSLIFTTHLQANLPENIKTTLVGAPLGKMGATYASYHIVGGVYNLWDGINSIISGIKGWFTKSDSDSYHCPLID